MDDGRIVELFWARSENAIKETEKKYGRYCFYIAENILHNRQDSEECVNDAYLKAWESIPPQKPSMLSTYIGRLTRNLALNKYRDTMAKKRGRGQTPLVLEELEECIPAFDMTESAADDIVLRETLDRFLGTLNVTARKIFVRRYWYMSPIREIADDLGIGESRVKMSLLRSRDALREMLEEEGISV